MIKIIKELEKHLTLVINSQKEKTEHITKLSYIVIVFIQSACFNSYNDNSSFSSSSNKPSIKAYWRCRK